MFQMLVKFGSPSSYFASVLCAVAVWMVQGEELQEFDAAANTPNASVGFKHLAPQRKPLDAEAVSASGACDSRCVSWTETVGAGAGVLQFEVSNSLHVLLFFQAACAVNAASDGRITASSALAFSRSILCSLFADYQMLLTERGVFHSRMRAPDTHALFAASGSLFDVVPAMRFAKRRSIRRLSVASDANASGFLASHPFALVLGAGLLLRFVGNRMLCSHDEALDTGCVVVRAAVRSRAA
jgi:hypothetical protein